MESQETYLRDMFFKFLNTYKENGSNELFYHKRFNEMKEKELTTLTIEYPHLVEYSDALASIIVGNYYRFEDILRAALMRFVKSLDVQYTTDSRTDKSREFYLSFCNLPNITPLRKIRPSNIGQLFSFSGTVTRTSDVFPELLKGTFKCKVCGTEIPDVSQNFQYTEPSVCPTKACNNHSKFELLTDRSVFVDWQRVLVQETTSETPESAMPRTIEVILRHDLVDLAKPGDKCLFVGTPVAVPETPKRAIGSHPILQRPAGFEPDGVTGVRGYGVRELTYRLSFLCSSVKSIQDVKVNETPDSVEKIHQMKESTNDIYAKLARSIAPNIYGHDDVKRGILLMLLGGVHKETPDGISLRGDINVCIVGDPSTAKSKFLKFVSHLMPRSIYTSGQSSSAAGLTATVTKDSESGDFTIEAGALMLADNGFCCIDEFDKMNPVDQVAIHEAMEQQTISIAKAGIHASLNAHTSILAAANPVGGRYNPSKSLRANLNLPSPIISRFDLFFVVVDEAKIEIDRKIARHIIRAHRNLPDDEQPDIFTEEELLSYIQFARTKQPKITDETLKELVTSFTTLRSEDATGANSSSYRITVRQLEALIRLSEALAKLYLSDEIKPLFVKEATRLLKYSIVQMASEPIQFNAEDEKEAYEEMTNTENQKEENRTNNVSNEPKQISYETYTKIAKMTMNHLQELANEGHPGLTIDQIIDWWLETNAEFLKHLEIFQNDLIIVRLTLKRLINLDHVLEENPNTHLITVSTSFGGVD